MLELLFLLIALGTPAAICIVALIGAYFQDSDDLTLIETQPARSPSEELRYRHRELEEMLETVNRRRRERGAPEQTLQQLRSNAEPHADASANCANTIALP